MKINKLLIANRGEIALRIMRTAREMGYSIVAVYSEYDRNAKHVQTADEAVYLPGTTLLETYLNINAIITAALETGANAIHPGYGFLSENPLFAEACEQNGLIFVGPSSASIRAMGNKIAAREIAVKHNVPVSPGITGTPEELLRDYKKVGLPVLVKAAAGGGGKGMRIVRSHEELEAALNTTASEAANYFGDSTIYIERFFDNPRHIEVQVLGDKHGNMIHLFERECSAQRRHQKIIEEAPSPTLTPEVREKMCAAAITLAASIGYYNAGTIEFLVDEDLHFYFLEMNTRIQVEHPVTEMITGVDIVRQQFLVAEGQALQITQNQLAINGHAVEVRIYAEDPLAGFMPSPGEILKYSYPTVGTVRVDDPALSDKTVIYPNFDPMISKVIAHGSNRMEAIAKLLMFMPQYVVLGIKTNITFLQTLLSFPDYVENRINTRYIDNNLDKLLKAQQSSRKDADTEIPLISGLLYSLLSHNESAAPGIWSRIGHWRIHRKIELSLDDKDYDLQINEWNSPVLKYTFNGRDREARLEENRTGGYTLIMENERHTVFLVKNTGNVILVKYDGHEFNVIRKNTAAPDHEVVTAVTTHKADAGDIISPMPGKVLSVKITGGAQVKKGDLLMVIEAMKMENNILAPYDGTVDKVLAAPGDNVDTSTHLVHLVKNEEVVAE